MGPLIVRVDGASANVVHPDCCMYQRLSLPIPLSGDVYPHTQDVWKLSLWSRFEVGWQTLLPDG